MAIVRFVFAALKPGVSAADYERFEREVDYPVAAGLKTIGLPGRDGGQLGRLSQLEINVADPHMGRIEDGPMIICHMLAYYFMDTEKAGGGC